MKSQYSTIDIKNKIYELVKDEYELVSEYVNSCTHVNLRHNKCNQVYPVLIHNFYKGKRCPKCAGNLKKTTEVFKKDIYDLVDNEYEVLSEYRNMSTNITFKHVTCGHVYQSLPSNFIAGNRCPKCSKKLKKNTEMFKEEVHELVGNEYTVVSEYINALHKIQMRHNECGRVYEVIPAAFLRGTRCSKCRGLLRKSTDIFKKEVKSVVGNEYKVIGEYINANYDIEIQHMVCGYNYFVRPNSFLRGARCPKCNDSKGEKAISNFLENHNIKFIRQYKFEDCRDKHPLPFDFAILNKDNEINLLIEYDGIQHFKPVLIFGGFDALKNTQRRDEIKNIYCNKNNLKIIRIPYTEFDNIDRILYKELNELIS